MKKIIFSIFVLALVVLGLASCGQSYSEDVLADNTKNVTYHVTNGYYNSWGFGGDYDPEKQAPSASQMKATSLAEIAKLDKDLAAALAKHNIKYLYIFEGFEAGTDKTWAGWTNPCSTDGNKTATELDGSYAVKAIKANSSLVDGKTTYTATTWMPDTDDKFHAESLTPETLWITPHYAADKDGNGFHWNMNPYLIKGAGEYTIILAIYSGEDLAGGFAAIKTKDLEEHKEEQYVINSWGLCGTMTGWGNTGIADVAMTQKGDVWECEVTFAEAGQFKVRANSDWVVAYGDAASASGNVEVAAGTYTVTFNPETHAITPTAK